VNDPNLIQVIEETTSDDGERIYGLHPAVRELVAELEQKLGRRPTLEETAKAWRATHGRSTT
jgi:hypothetical protein